MRYSFTRRALRPLSLSALFSLGLLWACGEDSTAPIPTQQGFILSVSIPGLTDRTFQGDSLYWRFLTGQWAGEEIRQLDLELLVLNPPAPLLSPLQFEIWWPDLEPPLPAAQSYALGSDRPDDVVVQANSNLGTWFAVDGQLTLAEVTDTSISGALTAILEPGYPPGSSLPDVRIQASFWAPHVPDLSVGD